MDIDRNKVLVTGASGLIGKVLLLQLLKRGYYVRALYHQAEIGFSHPQLEVLQGDILDVVSLGDAMQDAKAVYHCAALISYHPSDKYRLMKINIEGTANVINACLDAGVSRLVHVSSVAALGRSKGGVPVNEKLQWAEDGSRGNYSRTKFLGEMEVWRGIGEGLKAVIVNPSIVLGGDNWGKGSDSIFKSACDEFPWYSPGVGGFVDVEDVARAMILLMESDISAERFILNSQNLPFRDVFTMAARGFGKRPPHRSVNAFLAGMVWRAEAVKGFISGKKPLLTRETARSAMEKVYYDNSKILKALPGFTFTPIRETIARTCMAMKKKYGV